MLKSASMSAESPLLFCALEIDRHLGGIQRFNQRTRQALILWSRERGHPPPHIYVLRDHITAATAHLDAHQRCFNGHRIGFVLAALRRACAGNSIVVLDHAKLAPLALLFRLLRPSTPILLFVHGDEVWGRPSPIGHFRGWLGAIIIRFCITRIAAVSRHTQQRMAQAYGLNDDHFTLLPNAVDLADTMPPPLADRPPLVLTVTRLWATERRKHVDQIIRAFARIADTRPNAIYAIVGDGALRPELERLAQDLGVGDRVQFYGEISTGKLEALYRQARLFVLTSSKEGFGIVYLEAWRNGVAVICGAESAPSEFIHDGVNGRVVAPGDIDALAHMLGELLDKPDDGQALADHGKKTLLSQFSAPIFIKNMNTILDGMIAR